MYYIYGVSVPSLLTESTDSMIIGYHNNYYERKLMRGVATSRNFDTSISHLITLDRSCDKMALINYTKYN